MSTVVKTNLPVSCNCDKEKTAYVKGRAVADNLRSMMFLKDHFVEEKVGAVLVSLDAKKAFDPVDHGYI